MKPKPTSDGSLAGKVLAAQPHLMDPHFRQSLIFMVEHDHNGALGLVMNRPMGRNFGDVAQHADVAEPLSDIPVYMGGPVKPESLLVAMFKPGKSDASVQCALSSGLDELRRFQARRKGWLRAYAGYAGWSGGQLEKELEQGAWKVCPFSQHMMDERLIQGLWPFFIADDTRWHKLLAFLPRVPELN